jgi:hypothetical protein
MCESALSSTAWQGNGMGAAWERHAMCQSAFRGPLPRGVWRGGLIYVTVWDMRPFQGVNSYRTLFTHHMTSYFRVVLSPSAVVLVVAAVLVLSDLKLSYSIVMFVRLIIFRYAD